jgi:hypothetical protein
MSNTSIPLKILSRFKGWELSDSGSGESRLFIQANNEEILSEFTEGMTKWREDNDALFDLIGTVDLEQYVES